MAEPREHETSGRREGGPLGRSTESGIAPGAASGRPPAPQKVFQPGLPTGMGLGKYRILERVKTTHNAIIYKARDIMLDRLVTLKQMSPSLIDDPIACGHFRREAQFLARIPRGTSHVLGIHELIEDDLGLFIVKEHIPGDWLESLIAKRQTDLESTLRVLKTTALGIRTLHSMRVVHRGIHPGNILVARNGKAKITNLSTAALEGDLTPPPVLAPKYTAPELLFGEDYDDRVDIYSLGMILFEMCVGRPALNRHFAALLARPGDAKTRWIEWHLDPRAVLPNATDLNPFVPPQLAVLIRRMTAKNTDERIATIQEVLLALGLGTREPRSPLPYQPVGSGMFTVWPAERTVVSSYADPAMRALPATVGAYAAGSRTTAASTCTISVAAAGQAVGSAPSAAQGAGERTPANRAVIPARQRPRFRKTVAVGRAVSRVETVPVPETATQPLKEKPIRILPWILAAAIALCTLCAGGVWVWKSLTAPDHPISALLAEANAAFESRRWTDAERLYAQAAELEVSSEFQHLRGAAIDGPLFVRVAVALEENRLDDAERDLVYLKHQGADSARIGELQSLLWYKRDASRVLAAGTEDIERGNYETAELKADDYEKKARAAGLNPEEMRQRLELSRKERRYAESIRRSEAALAKGDFDAALLACTDAESIKITTETRQLHKRCLDIKERAEWTVRGDDAMRAGDFRTSVAAYERAIQLEPSDELEQRARLAGASLLHQEAQADLAKGDLLAAEQKLRTSLWRYPLAEVENLLNRLAPAFGAARMARRADRATEQQDYAEAVRLYKEALHALPEPAAGAVREKLRQAQQAADQAVRQEAGRTSP